MATIENFLANRSGTRLLHHQIFIKYSDQAQSTSVIKSTLRSQLVMGKNHCKSQFPGSSAKNMPSHTH